MSENDVNHPNFCTWHIEHYFIVTKQSSASVWTKYYKHIQIIWRVHQQWFQKMREANILEGTNQRTSIPSSFCFSTQQQKIHQTIITTCIHTRKIPFGCSLLAPRLPEYFSLLLLLALHSCSELASYCYFHSVQYFSQANVYRA